MSRSTAILQRVVCGLSLLPAGLCSVAAEPTTGGEPLPAQVAVDRAQLLSDALRLNDEAFDLSSAGKYHEAIVKSKESLVKREQAVGRHHTLVAASLNNLAHLQNDLGDYQAAEHSNREALRIRQELLGPEHLDTALSLGNLAHTLQVRGDLAGAKPLYEQALAIREKLLGKKHIDTGYALNNLGFFSDAAGEHAAARGYYEQALEIYQQSLGRKHRDTALVLNNLGVTANALGDYVAARRYFEQALAIRRELLGEQHPDTATSLNNLGALLTALGDHATARKLHQQALAIRKQALGDGHRLTGVSHTNLGNIASAEQDYDTAEKHYLAALAIHRAALGRDHPDTALALNNLAFINSARQDFSQAQKFYEQALAIREKSLGRQHPETAQSHNNLGFVLKDQGDREAAARHYRQAIAIYEAALGDAHPDTALALHNLGLLQAQCGEWEAAGATIDRCRRIARRHVTRVLPSLAEAEQLRFLDQNDRNGFQMALALGASQPTQGNLAERSAGWLLNGKAVVQESLAARTLLLRGGADQRPSDEAQRLLSVRDRLAALLLTRPRGQSDADYRRALEKLAAEERVLSRRLDLPAAGGGLWVDLAAVRRALPRRAVLVEIARVGKLDFSPQKPDPVWTAPHYVAWVLAADDQLPVEVIDLGPAAEIEAAIEEFRTAMQIAQSADKAANPLLMGGEAEAEALVAAPLARLGKLLWQPLAAHVALADEVVLSPDGQLWLVPWAALNIGAEPERPRYALERWHIRYVISGRDLVRQPDNRTTQPPVVFADPDFGPASQAIAAGDSHRMQFRAAGLVDIPAVSRLPATAAEGQAIATALRRLSNVAPQVYSGSAAREKQLRAVRSPQFLVVSTHGFFLPDRETEQRSTEHLSELKRGERRQVGQPLDNPLLRCGLLLAGCNHRDHAGADDDGVLLGLEIIGTELRGTQLVVLSACDTGLGRVNNGQGVSGLRQAFQLAGAQSVVSTLWQIPDKQSSQLMTDFFTNLAAGQSKAEALRNAQHSMIKARRARNAAAHPLFWAAWTVTGN